MVEIFWVVWNATIMIVFWVICATTVIDDFWEGSFAMKPFVSWWCL
jgi:hypothetical protein